MNLFEIGILDFIQAHLRTAFGDLLLPLVTHLGDAGVFWILMTLVLLAVPRTRKLGLVCAVSLLIDVILCNGLLKPLVARTRPYDVNPAIELLVSKPSDYSFPSGHAAASFTFAGALYFSRSRLWIPSAALASVIAFSRLYLYIHYPTDVLAGIVLGFLFGYLGALLTRWLTGRLQSRENRA